METVNGGLRIGRSINHEAAYEQYMAQLKLGYTVLTADTATQLADTVNRAIDDGWCPSGGVAVALSESGDYKYMVWAQAVVRSG